MMVFVLIFAVNFITCLFVRLIWNGRAVIDDDTGSWCHKKVFLLSGFLNQPETAYHFFDFTGFHRIFLRYSILGFNPKTVAKQLESLMFAGDLVCGISIGAKPIVYSKTNAYDRVLINPCTHPETLRPKYFQKVRILSPLAELLTYLLGWFAMIPVITVDHQNYFSLTLLIDQLFWIGYGNPGRICADKAPDLGDLSTTGIIVSTEDEFLDNRVVSRLFYKSEWVEIKAKHGYTADKAYAEEYKLALDFLITL